MPSTTSLQNLLDPSRLALLPSPLEPIKQSCTRCVSAVSAHHSPLHPASTEVRPRHSVGVEDGIHSSLLAWHFFSQSVLMP